MWLLYHILLFVVYSLHIVHSSFAFSLLFKVKHDYWLLVYLFLFSFFCAMLIVKLRKSRVNSIFSCFHLSIYIYLSHAHSHIHMRSDYFSCLFLPVCLNFICALIKINTLKPKTKQTAIKLIIGSLW